MNEKMKDNIYKSIKVIQSLLVVIFGIILCVYANNEKTYANIEYIVATILLVYGFLSISFALLFGKGIISIEVIGGFLITSLSIVLFVDAAKGNVIIEYIPIFLGSILVIAGATIIFEGIISLIIDRKHILRPILYFLASLIMITVGSVFIAYWENSMPILVIIMGIVFILLGGLMITLIFINPKNKILEASINDKKEISNKNNVVHIQKDNEVKELPAPKKRGRKPKNNSNNNEVDTKNDDTTSKN